MSKSSELKREKREAEKKLKQYEKRKKEVEAIQKDVDYDFDNNVKAVNDEINSVVREENAGTHHHFHYTRTLADKLDEEMENYVGSDPRMKGVIDSLGEEHQSINRIIADLEQKIRDLERAIEEAEEEEEEERKEKLKSLFGL